MEGVAGSMITYKFMEQEQEQPVSVSSKNDGTPSDAIIFFGLSLALGIACRNLLRGTRIPYTVALLILGIAIGSLEYGTHHRLGKIGSGIRIWSEIDPDLLLAVFLPALLFESAFSMEIHQIKRCIGQMILLAAPGVAVSTVCLGFVLKFTFPYNWSWKTSLLLGALLSATDPVAVLAMLKELGASKKLRTIIEGESMMNDGMAIVVYTLFYRMVLGETFNWTAIIKFLAQVSLGGVGIGLAFGIASVLWLGFIFNDSVIEISLTLAISYIGYFTAQEGAIVSGVLTVMSLGMFYSAYARTAFKGESQQSLHLFWEMVAYIANTLIFILSGVVIAESILGGDNHIFSDAIIIHRHSSTGRSAELTPETGSLFVFFTGGIVFLTMVVNGSTTQFLLHFLGMDKLSAAKKRILDFTKYEMLNKALEAFGELGDDEELGPSDWSTVKSYISCLYNIEGEHVHPHGASESDGNLDPMNVTDIRIRLLDGVQSAYSQMLNEGRISQTTANLLMPSVEEAIDLASHQPLCDWKGLKDNVHFPNYYNFLQSGMFPPKLVTYFIVGRLESACYICAAFLRAHRIARGLLHDFIGDSGVASAVINESLVEGEEARKFLEDVRITYPQTNLKKLLRNPLVKLPKSSTLHPMLGALPSLVREALVRSTRDMMKLRGLTLYKEGAKSNGIWLISNGAVKCESKMIRNNHPFYPTFSHGSTLGLFEVLTGKPYICDVIIDSVVQCFFIEADTIVSNLKIDPSVEDFLWQESAIFLSKLLLPQIFEKLAMQDLRALVAERSVMTIYIRGETIEIPPHSVAFLLDGYVKTQDIQELVTSPAALLPSHGNISFQNLTISGSTESSFSHQGSCYLVETRARVIIFDVAALEAEASLPRRSSSLLSHAMDHSHRNLGSTLMSWPEHSKQNSEGIGQQSNSLSEKAMQLSIYGSMVDVPNQSRGSSSNLVKPPLSLSYPTIGSHHDPLLVSVKSERPSTAKKDNDVRDFTGNVTNPPLQSTEQRIQHDEEDSSDDSGFEEDLIVRIDSPSGLSFHPSS
ncbi:hypothetical protein TanjilG_26520 [Lupinus angustifolius]|uniref:Cyclic nucleotide-binding domain-containing protein n=1 Tax=Lupinus angustifolius TaxID=3871 RepID=A0A4P1QPJ5_LUPAN|nr:hypothetical protein TanjilG_26520 [Lupinus angustifolius]